MLSKRILYFVDNKVYFHCPQTTWVEDCPVRLRHTPIIDLIQMLEPFREYKDLILLYSRRVLTAQADASRAMAGIIGRISKSQGWNMVEGMPTVALDNMMLFRRGIYPLSRRHGFPSYSWLGWKGSLIFMEGLYFFHGWINWHVRDPATGEILPVERRPISFPNLDTQLSGTKATSGVVTQISPRFGLLPGVQMDQGCPSDRMTKLRLPPTYSLLCFSTLAVFFAIEKIRYTLGIASITIPGRGSWNYEIGKVTLDGLDEFPVSHKGEFILLSKTIPSDEDCEALGLHAGMESYAVMLIEWQQSGMAERRGIGFLHAHEIKHSLAPGPVWKEIILG